MAALIIGNVDVLVDPDVLCRPLRSGPRTLRPGEVAQRACARLVANPPGEGWRWFGLLAVFALMYITFGIFAFESLLEES